MKVQMIIWNVGLLLLIVVLFVNLEVWASGGGQTCIVSKNHIGKVNCTGDAMVEFDSVSDVVDNLAQELEEEW